MNLPDCVIYGKGIRLIGLGGKWSGKLPPERVEGDIQGWSAGSRRRMRKYIMTHDAPAGWRTWAVDLTFPPLPFGRPDAAISQADALRIFRAWKSRCDRLGVGVIWRLEIQPRADTQRPDLRGIPQPHYHCILIAPPDVSTDAISGLWFGVLGERGAVRGAKKHACRVVLCEDFQTARFRYLLDHSTKKKANQVAVGWGRHWGVFGRSFFVVETGESIALTGGEKRWLYRLLRRGLRRRIPDKRASGGIPWGRIEIEPFPIGSQVRWLGGGMMVLGWDGLGLPPVADRRRIARALGVQRKNIWALKLGAGRSPAGFRFCNGAAYVRAARIMGQNEERKDKDHETENNHTRE